MNNFNHLQSMWKQQKLPGTSNPETMLFIAKQNKDHLKSFTSRDFFTLLFSFPIILLSFFYLKSSLAIFGMSMLVISALLHLYSRWKQWTLLKKIHFTEPPLQVLQKFEHLYKFMHQVYAKGIWIYFFFLFAGTIFLTTALLSSLPLQNQIVWGLLLLFSFGYVIIRRLRNMKLERDSVTSTILLVKNRKENLQGTIIV